jgi:hypothetical protein
MPSTIVGKVAGAQKRQIFPVSHPLLSGAVFRIPWKKYPVSGWIQDKIWNGEQNRELIPHSY